MPISWDKLFEVIIELSKIQDLKATSLSSIKGGLLTGAATFLGGFLLGKYGLLLGAAVGAGACAALTNEFKPVWIILRDLPEEKKQHLCHNLCIAFKNFGIQDLASLSTLLLSDVTIQSIAIREISRYMNEELNLRIL